MIVEVDGQQIEVPDDATPDEIDALSRQAAPTPRATAPMDDPTGSLAGGPPMTARELSAAGVGHGALKTWMGVKDVVGRVPGLGGIRPSPQEWQEFNAAGNPLMAAQRSDPTATVRLPVAMTQGMSPEDIAYVQKMADEAARAPINPGAEGSSVGTMAASYPVGLAAGKIAGPLLGRILPGGAQGAALGAVEGAAVGSTIADQGERLQGAGTGAAAGGLLGWLLQKSGIFVPRGQTGTKPPRVQITPEAQRLEAAGVTGLTPGQKAPQSTIGVLERASAENPLGLGPQRAAARDEFNAVARNQGVAPGAPIPAKGLAPQNQVKELLDGFDEAYSRFKDVQVDPSEVAKLPSAAKMPSRGVDARTAEEVKAEVENALTAVGFKPSSSGHAHSHGAPAAPETPGLLDAFGRPLPPPPRPPAPIPKATVGDLIKVRSNVREELRAAVKSQDFDRARLLDGAEEIITEGIESALSPADRAALQATDRQYARLMTALDAAPAGQDAFTPLQYLKQVEKRAGRRAFKSGGAGDLQDLGEAARTTFADLPLTGVRPGVLSSIPGAKMAGAPLSRLASTPAGQRFLFAPRPVYSGPSSAAPGAGAGPADFVEWLLSRGASPAFAEDREKGSGR